MNNQDKCQHQSGKVLIKGEGVREYAISYIWGGVVNYTENPFNLEKHGVSHYGIDCDECGLMKWHERDEIVTKELAGIFRQALKDMVIRYDANKPCNHKNIEKISFTKETYYYLYVNESQEITDREVERITERDVKDIDIYCCDCHRTIKYKSLIDLPEYIQAIIHQELRDTEDN